MVVVGGGAGVVLVVVVVILFILCGRRRQGRGPKDKAAEAGAVVVEKKSTSSSTSSVTAVGGVGGGLGGIGGLSGVGGREENSVGSNMGTAMKMIPTSLLSHDNQSTGQVSFFFPCTCYLCLLRSICGPCVSECLSRILRACLEVSRRMFA